jgi:hypothetical protein
VGSRVGLDIVVNRKIPTPFRDSNSRLSSPKPSITLLSYPGSYVTPSTSSKYLYSKHDKATHPEQHEAIAAVHIQAFHMHLVRVSEYFGFLK